MAHQQASLFDPGDSTHPDPAPPATTGPAARPSPSRRKPAGGERGPQRSMFDIDGGLAWPCERCEGPVRRPGLCRSCATAVAEAEQARLERQWRAEIICRFEIGEDAYAELVAESGHPEWSPTIDEALTAITQRCGARDYRVGLPESCAARSEMYARLWGRGRRYAPAPDGRRAPLAWCWGGLPTEVAVVHAGEDLEFTPGVDWAESWVDDTGKLTGTARTRYIRPVINVDVGDRL